ELERCWLHLCDDPDDELPMIKKARARIRQGLLDKVIARITPDCLLPAMLHPKLRFERVDSLKIVKAYRESFGDNRKAEIRNMLSRSRLIQQLNEWSIIINDKLDGSPCEPAQKTSNGDGCCTGIMDLTMDEAELEDSCVGDLFSDEKLPRFMENAAFEEQLQKRIELEVKRYLTLSCHDDLLYSKLNSNR
ncbi:hypothetical protein FOZ62_025075, partial [Perkinsus olseni]